MPAGLVSRWLRIALIGLALLLAVAPIPSSDVERLYSRGAYLRLQVTITPLANLVPFAILDVFMVAVVAAVVWTWIRRLARAGPGRRLRGAAGALADTVVIGCVLYVLFVAFWGLNYRRESLMRTTDFQAERVTPDALVALARDAVGELNRLHAPAHRRGWPALDRLPGTLGPAFARAQERLALARPAVPGRPKRTWLGWYFRRAAIDGMIDPFFLETLVNDDVLPFERPFVLAHEWAHLAGYAHEAEASFVGWLTCHEGNEAARYSAWLGLGPYVWRAVPDETRRSILARLEDGPRRDLDAIAERARRASPLVWRGARGVYDRFLRANRVPQGIASYDEVVALVLGVRLGP